MIKEGNIGEKPRSSISALIDVLCTERYDEDSLDGVAEIVDSINLQPSTGSVLRLRARHYCCSSALSLTLAIDGPLPPGVHRFTVRKKRLAQSAKSSSTAMSMASSARSPSSRSSSKIAVRGSRVRRLFCHQPNALSHRSSRYAD